MIETFNLRNELTDLEKRHAPDKLFYEGNLSLIKSGIRVAVVGSRKATPHGIKRAEILTKSLVAHQITVVSGLADGIDTVAHNTTIKEGGSTIAVLGTPLDKTYPAKNKELLELIKSDHLAISQFPVGYPFQKKNFPMRNKTMALITDATIIVEASEKSGTKHQGWEALRLGRLVFLMENIVKEGSISWVPEMIKYGAQILSRDLLSETLNDIPHFTATPSSLTLAN